MKRPTELVTGYLPTARGAVAATLCAPCQGAVRGVVLLVAPLFEERKACASGLHALGQHLGGAGLATLRVDVTGTGDSPGAPHEASLAEWEADLDAAHAVAARAGLPVVWAGIRFGALLALRAHGRHPGEALVLWEPLESGAAALRQGVQRKLVNEVASQGRAGSSRAGLERAWERGEGVDLDGHWVSGALHEALMSVECERPEPAVPALLVLHRAGARAEVFREAFGATLDVVVERAAPFWNLIGVADVEAPIRRITDWLGGVAASTGEAGAAEVARALAPPLSGWQGEHTVEMAMDDGGRVRGVWHAPTDDGKRLQVLLLAGWAGCRLGPHGLLRDAARALAAKGVAALRIDFRGRGDSDGEPASASISSMVEDACAALEWMRSEHATGGPQAVLGICSGAKVALMAAARAGGVPWACCWSPDPLGRLRPATLHRVRRVAILRTYARKLLRRETWAKLLTGRVQGRLIGRALNAGGGADATEREAEDQALRRLPKVVKALCLIGGSADPGAGAVEAAYAAYCEHSGIDCARQRIEGAGHGFYGTEWSAALIDATCEWLLARVEH